MTATDHVTSRRRPLRRAIVGARRPSVELLSEVVLANYVHDLSRRRDRRERTARPRDRGRGA